MGEVGKGKKDPGSIQLPGSFICFLVVVRNNFMIALLVSAQEFVQAWFRRY